MNPILRKADPASRPAGLLAVGVHEDGPLPPAAARLERASRGAIAALRRTGDFAGKQGDAALLYPRGVRARRVLLVGLGRASELSAQRLLLAAAQAARRARDLGAGTLALALHDTPRVGAEAALAAVAEGAVLGHYRHNAYRTTGTKPALTRIELLGPDAGGALASAVARGAALADAVCLARDLANTPGQDLVPEQLASRAREIGRRVGARVTVHDVAAMERLGMGCVLAVGRGSPNPPRFVQLEWSPAGAARDAALPTVVVIGKGVTFDTGGISLKPREGMGKMKYDMSGAAAVLGLFAALPAIAPAARVIGLVASAENAIGSRAIKPGDVVRALDGTTIEVTNTDAEGRLLLADALAYARRFEAEAVVDLATLTGAIAIALGRHAAGLFTADDALAAELQRAGEATGERLWRMPVGEDYLAEMRGDTADLVNSNEKREGGSCTAASFLSHFARDQRWAHLDIASTAWTYSERAHESRGANGFGVRLLAAWLAARAAGAPPVSGGAAASKPGRARRSTRRARPSARSRRARA